MASEKIALIYIDDDNEFGLGAVLKKLNNEKLEENLKNKLENYKYIVKDYSVRGVEIKLGYFLKKDEDFENPWKFEDEFGDCKNYKKVYVIFHGDTKEVKNYFDIPSNCSDLKILRFLHEYGNNYFADLICLLKHFDSSKNLNVELHILEDLQAEKSILQRLTFNSFYLESLKHSVGKTYMPREGFKDEYLSTLDKYLGELKEASEFLNRLLKELEKLKGALDGNRDNVEELAGNVEKQIENYLRRGQ